MNLQFQYALSTIVTAVAVLGLGAFVYFKNPRVKANQLWALFNVAIASWAISQTIYVTTNDLTKAYFFVRLSYLFGVLWIPTLYLHFILVHLNEQKRWPLYLAYGFSIAYLSQLLNPRFLALPRHFSPNLNFFTEPGPLWYPFFVLWSVIVIYGMRELYLKMRVAKGTQHNQLKYLLYSSSIGYIGGMSNFLPVFHAELTPYTPYGTYGIPIYTAIFASAIVRHQLMDIRVAITRTGLLLGTYLVVLGLPFLVGWWGKAWLEQRFGNQWWLIPLGLCTVLATIGPFAYAYLRRQAERLLLKEQRRYQRTLQHAARGMTQVRNLAKLVRLIVRVVSRTVRLQHASLFLWDRDVQRYLLVASHGPKRFSLESRYGLENDHALVRWLRDARRVLSREELTRTPQLVVEQELANLDAVLVVPGFIEHELVGFLALGEKLSGAGYSPDDLNAFSMLAHEAAMAIENARSYGELVKANEQLRLAYERLLQQERLVAAGQFATGMAHEIKNPLSAIKTFAEYLPEKYQDPGFREKFFRIVQSEIDRINTIVRELMEFAKPAPLQLESVTVTPLLEETLALMSSQFLKYGIRLEKSFSENGLTIQADPKQLKQVLLNLLLNSVEAMPAGGRLEVDTSVQDGQLILKIADSGCGIPEEHHHKLFDPFFTTKERGMGLGLAIVKGIMERHGGSIAIRSRPDVGTTVELVLPVAKQP